MHWSYRLERAVLAARPYNGFVTTNIVYWDGAFALSCPTFFQRLHFNG